MTNTPWDAPAVVDLYVRGLNRRRADFEGTLRECVIFSMSQSNWKGDGYIVRLIDGSGEWEGPDIAGLAKQLQAG